MHKKPTDLGVCHPCSVMLCGCRDPAKYFSYEIERDVLLIKPHSLQLCRTCTAYAFSCKDEKRLRQMERGMYFFSLFRMKKNVSKSVFPKN